MNRVWTLGELCKEAGIHCPVGARDRLVHGMTSDSRRVREGWLFIAIKGLHVDGRQYARDAVARGAVAVVWDDAGTSESCGLPTGATVLRVSNGRRAMAFLWSAWYGHPERRLRLVGVTGTNGKTTVTTMLWHILQAAGRPCGLIGTVETLSPKGRLAVCPANPEAAMTTPDPEELFLILDGMARDGAEIVVMEVSSHALALGKVEPLCFDLAVMTNLSCEHLDLHGDMEQYYMAKRQLFEKATVAIVNAEDQYGKRLMHERLLIEKWIACRRSAASDIYQIPHENAYIEQVQLLGVEGSEFRLATPAEQVRLRCLIPGDYNVTNAAEAALAALELGVPLLTVKDALGAFSGVCGRMERVALPGRADCTVYIDFAHTPDALENLLRAVHGFRRPEQRIVLLFGCGGDRDRSKRREMAHVACRMADMTVLTTDNSRTEPPEQIMNDILKGMDKEREYVVIYDRAEAIRYTVQSAKPGDIILLCGKGHEAYEIDKEGKHPFSESAIVKQAAVERWGTYE